MVSKRASSRQSKDTLNYFTKNYCNYLKWVLIFLGKDDDAL